MRKRTVGVVAGTAACAVVAVLTGPPVVAARPVAAQTGADTRTRTGAAAAANAAAPAGRTATPTTASAAGSPPRTSSALTSSAQTGPLTATVRLLPATAVPHALTSSTTVATPSRLPSRKLSRPGGTTSVAVRSSTGSSTYDAPVSFVATVTASNGIVLSGGQVLFSEGGRQLGLVTLSKGTAAFATRALAVGTREVSATYTGTALYQGAASAPVEVDVAQGQSAATNPEQDAAHDSSDLTDTFSPSALHVGWSTALASTADNETPSTTDVLAAGGEVFAVSRSAATTPAMTLDALSAVDGSILWQDPLDGADERLVYDGGQLFVGQTGPRGVDPTVMAIDAAGGSVVWSDALPTDAYVYGLTSFDGSVYLSEGEPGSSGQADTSPTTIGLRETDGVEDYDAPGAYYALPTVSDSGVYAASTCAALETDPAGRTVWSRTFNDCGDGGGFPAALTSQGLYTYGDDSSQVELDPSTGDSVGTWAGDGPPSFDPSHRIEIEASSVAATATALTSADWTYTAPFATSDSSEWSAHDPVLATNGLDFVRDITGKVHGLDSATGRQVWSAVPPGAPNPMQAPSTTPVVAGDGRLFAATEGTLTAYVDGSATTTSLAASTSSVRAQSPVALTARVATADGGTATGRVLFVDGADSAPVGDVALVHGVATLTTSALVTGTRQLSAVYEGDRTYARSTSATTTVTVTAGPGVVTGQRQDAAHDGSDPDDTFDPADFGQRWTVDLAAGSDSEGVGVEETVIGPGRVFAEIKDSGGESLVAYSAVDGSLLWTVHVANSEPIAYDGGRVFLEEPPPGGYYVGKLDAFDAATGALDWSVPSYPGDMSAYDGALYLSLGPELLGMSIVAEDDGSQIGVAEDDSYGPPSVDATGIYSGGCNLLKTTFDGTDVWSYTSPDVVDCEHSYDDFPPVHGGEVYGDYAVLDATTGQPVGQAPDGIQCPSVDLGAGSCPSFDDDTMYSAVEPNVYGGYPAGITATVQQGTGSGWHSAYGGAPAVATPGIVFTAGGDSVISLRSSDGTELFGDEQTGGDEDTVEVGSGIVLLDDGGVLVAYGPAP